MADANNPKFEFPEQRFDVANEEICTLRNWRHQEREKRLMSLNDKNNNNNVKDLTTTKLHNKENTNDK